jgi:hypothetical protein
VLLLFLEKLTWGLSVVVYLLLVTLALDWVWYTIKVDPILISQARVGVEAPLSILVSLLAPEDVIYPAPQILTNVVGLKSFSQVHHKLVRIVLAPRRQLNVVYGDPVLLNPKIYTVLIYEHFGAVEEFGNQFAHISIVIECAIEGVLD